MDWKVFAAAPLVAFLVVASANDVVMPSSWSSASTGKSSKAFVIGLDPQVTWQGQRSITVRAQVPADDIDYGAAIQYVTAHGYEGRRVRFSGVLKTDGITQWAGVFLQSNPDGVESYWGSRSRDDPPRGSGSGPGSADWRRVGVVIDVPAASGTMSMGLVLVGNGQAWLSDLRFEEVGPEVPVTVEPIGLDPQKVAGARAKRLQVPAQATKQVPANLALLP